MCLAVPYTITEIGADGVEAKAVSGGVNVGIRLDLIDKPEVGDVVLVHAGFAIQKLDPAEAKELEDLWEEALSTIDDDEPPLSEYELEQIAQAEIDIANGDVSTWEDVKKELANLP